MVSRLARYPKTEKALQEYRYWSDKYLSSSLACDFEKKKQAFETLKNISDQESVPQEFLDDFIQRKIG